MKDINFYKETYGQGWLAKYQGAKRSETCTNKSKYHKNSTNKRKAFWGDYDFYRDEVKQLTNKNSGEIPNIHKRGFNTYHIDHKISIKWGYDNGILAEHIAHPSNCEMIWWKDNIRKSDKCKIDENNEWIISQ
jgi:hypothetical protein